MFSLVQNENMKIYRRIRTWILIGLLLLSVVLQAAITNSFLPQQEDPNWKQDLLQQNEKMRKLMADEEFPMPESVKKSTEIEIKKNEYAIENNIAPGRKTGWAFVQDSSAQITLVTIFGAIIAGDIVASEFTWGTIKLLLIRPVSRTKILLSKYLAALLFAILLFAVLFAWALLIGGLFFGFGGIDQPYIYSDAQGNIQQMKMLTYTLQTYAVRFLTLTMIITLAFTISASFRSSSMAISLALLVMFLGNVLTPLLNMYDWGKYVLFPNLDLIQYFEGGPAAEGMSFAFSIAVLAVYYALFHLIAWLMFVKRDVAA